MEPLPIVEARELEVARRAHSVVPGMAPVPRPGFVLLEVHDVPEDRPRLQEEPRPIRRVEARVRAAALVAEGGTIDTRATIPGRARRASSVTRTPLHTLHRVQST